MALIDLTLPPLPLITTPTPTPAPTKTMPTAQPQQTTVNNTTINQQAPTQPTPTSGFSFLNFFKPAPTPTVAVTIAPTATPSAIVKTPLIKDLLTYAIIAILIFALLSLATRHLVRTK